MTKGIYYNDGEMVNDTKDVQKIYMNQLENLISNIRCSRACHGEDPENHEDIWTKINNIYDKLTDDNKYIFDNCIVN